MTISNGNIITAVDLDTKFQQSTASLRTDNQSDGYCSQMNFEFKNVSSSTAATYLTQTFVAPDDLELMEVGCYCPDSDGYTVTTTLSGTLIKPVSTSAVVASDETERYNDFSNLFNPFQILLKGATYSIVVTTSGAAVQTLRPFLLLRHRRRRY